MTTIGRRDTSIDAIKFVLIALVVFGHIIPQDRTEMVGFVWRYKLIFNMPIFVFLSGFVFNMSQDAKKFWNGIMGLLATYILFQFLHLGDPLFSLEEHIRQLGFWEAMNGGGWLYGLTHMHVPGFALWYIFSLMIWRIILFYLFPPLQKSGCIFLGISLVVSLLAGFVPITVEFAFQKTFTYFPFFVMGFLARTKGWYAKARTLPHWICLLIMGAYAVILFIGLRFKVYSSSIVLQNYCYLEFGVAKGLIYRMAFYGWVIPLSVAVMNLVPNMDFLSREGRRTHFYYLYHVFVIVLIRSVVAVWHLPVNMFMVIVYWLIAMIVLYSLSKIDFLHKLANPYPEIKRIFKQDNK